MSRSLLKRALFEPFRSQTLALSLIRTLFNYFVVAGHAPVLGTFLLDYPHFVTDLDPNAHSILKLWFQLTTVGVWTSVDVFLFISGFLLMSSLAAQTSQQQPNAQNLSLRPLQFVRYILYRWLRLAALYITVAAALALANMDECVRWSEVFLVPNWFQGWDKRGSPSLCVMVGWSVHVDFQMHIVIGILAVLSSSWHDLSILLHLLTWTSAIARGFMWLKTAPRRSIWYSVVDHIDDERTRAHVADFLGVESGKFNLTDPRLKLRKDILASYAPFYFSTMARGGAACVGALTWIAMHCNAPICDKIRRNVLSWALSVCAWIVFHYWTMRKFSDETLSDWFVLYEAFGRTLVTLAMAVVVILTCSVGERSTQRRKDFAVVQPVERSALKKMLMSVFAMLSRASYAIYLTHPFTGWCLTRWPLPITRSTYTIASMLFGGLKMYILTAILAIPFCIIEECVFTIRKKLVDLAFSERTTEDKRNKAS